MSGSVATGFRQPRSSRKEDKRADDSVVAVVSCGFRPIRFGQHDQVAVFNARLEGRGLIHCLREDWGAMTTLDMACGTDGITSFLSLAAGNL